MRPSDTTALEIKKILSEQFDDIVSTRSFKLSNRSFTHENILPFLFEELSRLVSSADPPIFIEKIQLSANSLKAIPEELHLICTDHLKLLDLSENSLKDFPLSIIRSCHGLESLDLSNNRLQILPRQIDQLRCLRHLDLRHNNISFLPPVLGELLNLETINVEPNPLVFPSHDEMQSFAGSNELKAFLISNSIVLGQRVQQSASQEQASKRLTSPTSGLVRNRSYSDSRGKSLKASRRMGLIIGSNKQPHLLNQYSEELSEGSSNSPAVRIAEARGRSHTVNDEFATNSQTPHNSPLNAVKRKPPQTHLSHSSENGAALPNTELHEGEQKPSAYFRRLSTLQEVPADESRLTPDSGRSRVRDDLKPNDATSVANKSPSKAPVLPSTNAAVFTPALAKGTMLTVNDDGGETALSLNTVVRVARKMLFSLSELHSSVKRLTGFCSEKKILSKVISLLRTTKENIDNLVETMEFVEGKNRDPELIMSALHTCILSFKMILTTLLDLYSSFVSKIDVCFVRMVYLSVFGSLNELQNAFKLISYGQKSRNTEPYANDLKAKPQLTGSTELYFDSQQSTTDTNGSNIHSASEIVPSLDEVDEKLYQSVELATSNAQIVFNELTKAMNRSAIANATSSSSQTINSLVALKFKDLTNVCMTLMDITKRLKVKLGSIRISHNPQYRKQFWDDINLFLKAIIQTFSSVKVIMKDAPILNEVRQSMANLTKTTKDLTILLEASSYKSISDSQQSSPFNSTSASSGSSVLHSASHLNLIHLNNSSQTAVRTPLGATVGAAAAQAILTPSEPFSAGGPMSSATSVDQPPTGNFMN